MNEGGGVFGLLGQGLLSAPEGTRTLMSYTIQLSRFLLPLLALVILYRCVRSMLRERYEPETWAYLVLPGEVNTPLRHWECIVGRARSSDIVMNLPTISRSHAALIRDDKGFWLIYDLGSKGGVAVNGQPVPGEGLPVEDGDTIALAGVQLGFISLTDQERISFGEARTAPGRYIHPGVTFFILTVFQTLMALQHSITAEPSYALSVTLAFGLLAGAMWAYYLIMRSIRRMGFEVETIAFFLTTLGFSVAATSVPGEMAKQSALFFAGLGLFLFLGWWLRDLGRVKKLRWAAGGLAIAMLALNLLLAQEVFGAKNWISVGGFAFQPSELVKIAYIYAGAATLDRLFMGRNLFLYIAFSAACVGALALMGDFGTALIFFATFLVISFLRSGNLATLFLAVSGAGLAGMLMLTIRPHIAQRFATWGHVWEYANEGGYQQTRALSAAASGGLFGQGGGNGWLHTITAADTDLVFCVLCEELGLIVGFAALLAILLLAAFTVRTAASGRSSFYVIAACACVSMLMVQMGLNVFGSLDMLPFTGVTFPFVSRGGSSLISCWALMAFIKAGDTRKNASFAIKLPSRRRVREARLYQQENDRDEDSGYTDGAYGGDGYTDDAYGGDGYTDEDWDFEYDPSEEDDRGFEYDDD